MAGGELHRVVASDDLDGLTAALDDGADPLALDALGDSLLARAASEGRLEIVSLLLSRGVPADHSGSAGNSPLMAAAAGGHVEVVERLLAAGADPSHANKWGFSARDWSAWSENAADITARLRENL